MPELTPEQRERLNLTTTDNTKTKRSRKPDPDVEPVEQVAELKRSEALAKRQQATARQRQIVEDTLRQVAEDELIRLRTKRKAEQLLAVQAQTAIETDPEILEAEIASDQSFDDLFDGVALDFFGSSLPQLSGS